MVISDLIPADLRRIFRWCESSYTTARRETRPFVLPRAMLASTLPPRSEPPADLIPELIFLRLVIRFLNRWIVDVHGPPRTETELIARLLPSRL